MKLPIFLQPKYKCELARLGKENDGGYLIPKESLKDSKIILGFGLGDDWSFEKDFKKLSKAKVICFDHSVNLRFWLIRFFRDFVDLILFKKRTLADFLRFFTYLKYKIFFNGKDAIHEKKVIAPINQKFFEINNLKVTDLDQILLNKNYTNFFLKVDIENHEYRILNQIQKYQKYLTGLVIEFHDCDHHLETIKKFIDNLKLQLVHIHVNNFGIINEFGIPTVLELTFSPENYNTARKQGDNIFPIKDLDQPNNKFEKDKTIVFE